MYQNNNTQYIIIGIALIISIIIGVLLFKFDATEPKFSQASLITTPDTYDFGEISMANGKVSTKVVLKNDGDENIKIQEVTTSCMCTIATLDGIDFGMHQNPSATFNIPAKGSKEMTITFDPNAHGPDAIGPITRIVSISTNSEATPNLEIKISGNVIK